MTVSQGHLIVPSSSWGWSQSVTTSRRPLLSPSHLTSPLDPQDLEVIFLEPEKSCSHLPSPSCHKVPHKHMKVSFKQLKCLTSCQRKEKIHQACYLKFFLKMYCNKYSNYVSLVVLYINKSNTKFISNTEKELGNRINDAKKNRENRLLYGSKCCLISVKKSLDMVPL